MLNSCFTALFEDRVDTFQRSKDSKKWLQLSRFNRFKDSDLLSVINLKSTSVKAVTIDKFSHFAVLAIDIEEPEERLEVYTTLRQKLEELGVTKPCNYLVNEFESVHFYLCFNEKFDSREFNPLLKGWLIQAGLSEKVSILSGNQPVEIPLQNDFAWINQSLSTVVRRKDIATDPAIAMFLSDLNKGMLDLELFTLSITPLVDLTSLEELDMTDPGKEESVLDFTPKEDQEEVEASLPSQDASENVVQFKRRPVIQPEAKFEECDSENKSEVNTQQNDIAPTTNFESNVVSPEPTIEPVSFENDLSGTMLPPPGTTSFRQLSIPFNTPSNID